MALGGFGIACSVLLSAFCISSKNPVVKVHDAATPLVYKQAVTTFKPESEREPADANRPDEAPPALA